MSFELNADRTEVAFYVRGGTAIEDFDETAVTLVLDISSNMHMDMGDHAFRGTVSKSNQTPGNFSGWVALKPGQGVAVSGLTSCGAVFLANQDFSRIAAAHMSGDAHFAEDWATQLGKDAPHFLLWGTGPDGSRSSGGQVLWEYMKGLKIPPARAQAVAGCGCIALTASGVALASRSTRFFACKRSGQAIQKTRGPVSAEDLDRLNFYTLCTSFNSTSKPDQFMLFRAVASYVGVSTPFAFDEEEQQEAIANGKEIFGAYYRKLPSNLKATFLKFEIFKLHPKVRP